MHEQVHYIVHKNNEGDDRWPESIEFHYNTIYNKRQQYQQHLYKQY